MEKKSVSGTRRLGHGNNPLFNRFDKLPAKAKNRFPRVAYVLQGGGSLGAYQFGVIKRLLEAGYEPDWISATSIGAIQAAIIVGNPPNKRIERLEEFWRRVAPPTPVDFMGKEVVENMYGSLGSLFAVMFGQPGFFYPRWCQGVIPLSGYPATLSYYDTTPLKETLLELVDFDLLNACPIRLSLGAVQISTGKLIYFNNINYRIGPEHVMASGALPPGFPAVEVDGELYWDGGVHSNTPLEVILDAKPGADTLCFIIDCFGGQHYIPSNMDEVDERRKDIGYGTHAHRNVTHYLLRQKMRHNMQALVNILTPKQKRDNAELLSSIIEPHHCTLVHAVLSVRHIKSALKDCNFGWTFIKQRIEIGYQDAQDILAEESQWGYLPKDGQSRLYEAPNNYYRLMREKNKHE